MGKLNIIIGPMYSGKTSELLSRYLRYKVAGKKCLLIKFKDDNRYDSNKIVTHNLFQQDANSCTKLEDFDSSVNDYDVILIDEIQFYPDASIFCDKWANENKIVEASGLNGDFQRKPFEQISLLIPLCDNITHLVAVDKSQGDNAPFTIRLSNDNQQTLIGGDDIYQAMNRKNYMKYYNITQQHLCI
jgi:thymidine kinase